MTPKEKQKLRKAVLKIHYELSEGNSWNLVMRPEVAEKLKFQNFNDDELLGAIKYLEDKDFLKAYTNVQDQITDSGIDEVENGFPNFPTEENESNINEELESELIVLLREIKNCYEMGEKEILKKEKLEESESLIKAKLEKLIPQLNDGELSLQFEKLKSIWRTELKSGFQNKKTVIKKLGKYEEFIKKILERAIGAIPRPEAFISAGRPYEGRKTLRLMIRGAKQKIWIVDNFMHPETLILLEPYLNENQNLEIRLLTRQRNNSNFHSFRSDLLIFIRQYPQAKIEAKENDQYHGRFIIIDDNIYHSGHSFHDIGNKADAINLIQEEVEQQKILTDFNDWWSNGNIIQ